MKVTVLIIRAVVIVTVTTDNRVVGFTTCFVLKNHTQTALILVLPIYSGRNKGQPPRKGPYSRVE